MHKLQKKSAFWKSFSPKIAALGLVAASAIGASPSAHAQFGSISEREEIRAGEQIRERVYREYGRPLSSGDARQQRVQRLGRLLTQNARRKNIPYSFTVLNNDRVLNAFAAPGGPTFYTTRLLSVAQNDAELAFVIAHEIGHIENRHAVKAAQRQQQIGLAAGVLGAILGRGGGSNTTNLLINLGATLGTAGYSRENEREADVFAARAMSQAGFDPRAGISMLSRLGSSSGGITQYLSTHPNPSSRQQILRDVIASENLLQKAGNSGGPFLDYGQRVAGASLLRPIDDEEFSPVDYASDRRSGAPSAASTQIALRIAPYGGYNVVMGAVTEIADAFGGRVETRNDTVTITRGGSYARFNFGASSAVVNGRTVTMSAPTRVFEGRLHASIRTIMEGLGGDASYDAARNAVILSLDGQTRTVGL